MKYEVIHSMEGRVRLRCGKWVFTEEETHGVAAVLRSIEGVSAVSVRKANGSVLVEYSGDALGAIYDAMDKLDVLDLPRAESDEAFSMDLINNRFQIRLAETVAWRIVRRAIVPMPIRCVLTVIRAMGYLRAGLGCLAKGRLKVEVLDATAIMLSLARGQFATAGSVMFLLRISEILAEYTQERTRCALRNNLALHASTAWLVCGETEVEVAVDKVSLGDVIRVRTGSLIPLDGVVTDGEGEVNESSMTGESALVHKAEGSTVYAGTAVDNGSLLVKVTAVQGDSRIDGIVALVENSEELKASVQSKAEKLADSMVPFSLGLFLLNLALTRNVNRAMSVLMVDYSCAIKLATPIAVMSAMREATAMGIVAKGGKYIEAFAEADTIVFDKTGTLTKATPRVEAVVSFNGIPEDDLLRMAACLEEHFPHSMAHAIVREAREKGLEHKSEDHAEVEYIVAHGIASVVDGKKVRVGSAHFIFDDEGVERPNGMEDAVRAASPAGSVVYVAIDGMLQGAICISDPLRPEAKQVIDDLRKKGFAHIAMLTGDSDNAASVVANALGLDDYHAQVLPEDKASYVEQQKRLGRKVAMVGDGVNDSPALAGADVSVTLSDASDIARSVADVAVSHSSLASLLELRDLSIGLMRRIDRSHRFIVAFNTALIVLGALGVSQPSLSAALHNASTVALAACNTRPLAKEGKKNEEA